MQYAVQAAVPAGFNPEAYGDLYYWWDFTDDTTMTFSAGTTIATVSNKAARTSGNETLNTVVGTPTFTDSTNGSRFDSLDSICNSPGVNGGNLDTLMNGVSATVIWIGEVVGYVAPTNQDGNNLWSAAGNKIDDIRVSAFNKSSSVTGTRCPTDNIVSPTYQYELGFHDWTGTSQYSYRTYDQNWTAAGPTMLSTVIDYGSGVYNGVSLAKNDQLLCTTVPGGTLRDNTGTSKGFMVNARSRTTAAQLPANQYVRHILIYNGTLDDTAIADIYNNWQDNL